MRFTGMVAVVTGGATGIGRACGEALAAEGAAVVLAGLAPAAGEAAAAAIRAAGGRAEWVHCDVSAAAQVQALMAGAAERNGRIDVLVNSAGIGLGGHVADISEAEWNQVIGVNLTGAFLCSRYAIPHMRRAGGGAIVHIGSVLGHATLPNCSAYCASKAGLLGLTRAMALDLARENIRVNAVSPGSTDTAMMWEGLTVQEKEQVAPQVASATPVGRVAAPAEIARAVLFLASGEAGFATGAELLVDGGLSCRLATVR